MRLASLFCLHEQPLAFPPNAFVPNKRADEREIQFFLIIYEIILRHHSVWSWFKRIQNGAEKKNNWHSCVGIAYFFFMKIVSMNKYLQRTFRFMAFFAVSINVDKSVYLWQTDRQRKRLNERCGLSLVCKAYCLQSANHTQNNWARTN